MTGSQPAPPPGRMTEAEFRALYDAAGFELTRLVPTTARLSVIEGVRR